MDFSKGSSKPKAWKSVWGSGQGIGDVKALAGAAELVDRIASEYEAAGRDFAREFAE